MRIFVLNIKSCFMLWNQHFTCKNINIVIFVLRKFLNTKSHRILLNHEFCLRMRIFVLNIKSCFMHLNEQFTCKNTNFVIFVLRKNIESLINYWNLQNSAIFVSFTDHPSRKDRRLMALAACKLRIYELKPRSRTCHRKCATLGRFHTLWKFC